MRVAFIDDGIMKEAEGLPQKVSKYVITSNLKGDNVYCLSHATLCFWIFNHYISNKDYNLFDIKIMEPQIGKTEVNNLEAALKICLKENVDIICMSVGSTDFITFDANNLLEKLYHNGAIMIAAANNDGRITYPAYSKYVIGVKCDYSNILTRGEFVYSEGDIGNIDIISHCNFQDVENDKDVILDKYNSFSTPYIAALVFNAIQIGIEKEKIREFLKTMAVEYKQLETFDYNKKSFKIWNEQIDIPIVAFDLPLKMDQMSFLHVLNNFKDKGYDIAGITSDVTVNLPYLFDINKICINESYTVENVIKLVMNATNSDIILLNIEETHKLLHDDLIDFVVNKLYYNTNDQLLQTKELDLLVDEIISKFS